MLFIQVILQPSQAGVDGFQFLLHGVGDAHLVHVAVEVGLFSGDAHYSGGDAHGGGVFRDLLQHHGVGGDPGPVPHLEGPQHLGPGGDQHVVADGGVALALVLPGAP